MKTLALAIVSLSILTGEGVLRAERDVPRPERIRHVPAEYPAFLYGVLPTVMGVVNLEVELNEEKQVVKALEKAAKDPDEYIREAANALLRARATDGNRE